MAKAIGKKIITTHPGTQRKSKIDAPIYASIKAAIIQSLKGSKGKTFTELTDDTTRIIRKKNAVIQRLYSLVHYFYPLDLETRGVVETFTKKGKKLNCLKK